MPNSWEREHDSKLRAAKTWSRNPEVEVCHTNTQFKPQQILIYYSLFNKKRARVKPQAC